MKAIIGYLIRLALYIFASYCLYKAGSWWAVGGVWVFVWANNRENVLPLYRRIRQLEEEQ
jgi:hypothetical protein